MLRAISVELVARRHEQLLASLDDRALADIGVSRHEIPVLVRSVERQRRAGPDPAPRIEDARRTNAGDARTRHIANRHRTQETIMSNALSGLGDHDALQRRRQPGCRRRPHRPARALHVSAPSRAAPPSPGDGYEHAHDGGRACQALAGRAARASRAAHPVGRGAEGPCDGSIGNRFGRPPRTIRRNTPQDEVVRCCLYVRGRRPGRCSGSTLLPVSAARSRMRSHSTGRAPATRNARATGCAVMAFWRAARERTSISRARF